MRITWKEFVEKVEKEAQDKGFLPSELIIDWFDFNGWDGKESIVIGFERNGVNGVLVRVH